LVRLKEAYRTLGHDTFAASTSTNHEVDLAAFEGGAHILEHMVIAKRFH
jgi:hypothetical protein